ncbi:Adenylate cyclase type 9 [Holothuria leucospilota]|uniref:adenylate cyclase n=1 Tax=Holothuria leucospilota TaxID=206669 RepID=A0A9Q1GYP2_HOLLE|nr:Adenylate cyclase type 9 [Holothuria leucospilota]
MDSATDTEVHFDPSKKPADDAVTLRLNRTESSRSQRRRSSEASKGKRTGCCPKLFERASGSWWNPKFNSPIIEQQFLKNCFSQVRRRFRSSLLYFILVTLAWMIYIPLHILYTGSNLEKCEWERYEIALGCLLAFCLLLLILTATRYYQKCVILSSFVLAFVLCSMLVMFTIFNMTMVESNCNGRVMSSIATFALALETILMTYTVMPISFLRTALMMIVFSVVYETLYFISLQEFCNDMLAWKIITKLFLHTCVHVMGTHIFFMSQVRTRSTFMKIGEAIVARRQHKKEKQVKESTIHALMPSMIAKELLSKSETEGGRQQAIFRPFYMNRMEDVSILFADIAGFTQMSANKSAETLVGLLNNLFGRFDILCTKNKCEKICTLGDCYYCVSGCPEARTDHATCCVKMGLSMIEAIKDFCKEKGEKVNMRVGVHTGTVLCGIIGNRRFKFDVWSNDVTIANKMEASGEPGKVHVSAETAKFLGDQFLLEESPAEKRPLLLGMKTYFIMCKNDTIKTSNHSGTPTSVHKVGITINSNDNVDSESANSDPAAIRDGTTNQTNKPLLSAEENKVPSENNTPQEVSLLTSSHLADGTIVSMLPPLVYPSPLASFFSIPSSDRSAIRMKPFSIFK